MAYDPSDLRSQLSTAGGTATMTRSAGANVAPQYFEFDQMAPSSITDAGSSLWWIRSQACVVNYARARAGDTLERRGQPDEYVVLLPDVPATLTAGGEEVSAPARAVVVMPPGDSAVTLTVDGQVLRLFSPESADLCDLCANQDFYADPDPNVAPFAAWPAPPDGHRIRVYPLDDVERDPNRFGRLFRCSTVMVNYFYEDPGPRDPHKLSPHHHDDFEQLSLQLGGAYVHHIRTPWTVDMDQWREDEHQYCTTPSVTVIPPPAVHTSQGVGDTPHQLVDIFAPPRFDFSERPGWVLNADEYPMPGS